MAPVAMISALAGHEARRRGDGADGAGLVSEIVVPMKSSGEIVPLRERATRSSKAFRKSAKSSLLASLMFGTSSVRVPSFFCTSTAMPRRTWSRWMRWGWPSISA